MDVVSPVTETNGKRCTAPTLNSSGTGAVLLINDFPIGSQFGIDCKCWTTGPNFRGIKFIPHGVHFVYFNTVGNFGDVGPRCGFFHCFLDHEVVRKRYHGEELVDMEMTVNDMTNFWAGVRGVDRFLAPYPEEILKAWLSLSSYITGGLVDVLNPDSLYINSAGNLVNDGLDKNGLPKYRPADGTVVKYHKVQRGMCPDGSSASQISAHFIDSSLSVEDFLKKCGSETALLGELQYSFLSFLLGQEFESFEHWKRLLDIVCCADVALRFHADMYHRFITMLYFQLKEVPNDFFVDIVYKDNFLCTSLSVFFANLSDIEPSSVSGESKGNVEALRKKGGQFKANLVKSYGWDFDVDANSDDLPVIVETDLQ